MVVLVKLIAIPQMTNYDRASGVGDPEGCPQIYAEGMQEESSAWGSGKDL